MLEVLFRIDKTDTKLRIPIIDNIIDILNCVGKLNTKYTFHSLSFKAHLCGF